jgi:hypothetical protein
MPSRAQKPARAFTALGFATFAALFSTRTTRAETPDAAPPQAAPPQPTATAATGTAPAATDTGDPTAGKPARPPLPPEPEQKTLPWERALDIGGDFTIVARPATSDVKGRPSAARYQPATGFGIHIRWPIVNHFNLTAYFVDCHLPVVLPEGSLGLAGRITSPPVETFVFGARLSPSMTWGRLTGWLTAGAGWGRFEFARMQVSAPGGGTYVLRERGASFVEFPLGLGLSFELVPHWLALEIETTAAFVAGQHGDAFDNAQTVDSAGHLQTVGPLPVMDASIVQTIGLSLLL